jgi:hypothetical protein
VVFLIAEQPTQGIAWEQVASLQQIIRDEDPQFASPVRNLGPAFSGSFPSLVWIVKELADNRHHLSSFLICSGGATVADYATETVSQIARNGATVNLRGTWRRWIQCPCPELLQQFSVAALGY